MAIVHHINGTSDRHVFGKLARFILLENSKHVSVTLHIKKQT